MEKKKKVALYGVLLAVGLLVFILEVFVFQYPNGILGLIICLSSIYFIIGSIIKLCKLSERFENEFFAFLDIMMWLP